MALDPKKSKASKESQKTSDSPKKLTKLNGGKKNYIKFHPVIPDAAQNDDRGKTAAHKTLRPRSVVNEAIYSARRKRANAMRRNHARLMVAKRKKSNTMAHTKQLHRRAERIARRIIHQRNGTVYNKANAPEKNFSDHILHTKKGMINHIVSRLMPVIKRKEQRRLQAKRTGRKKEKQGKSDMATLNSMRVLEGVILEKKHYDHVHELSNVALGKLKSRPDATGRAANAELKRRNAAADKKKKLEIGLKRAHKVAAKTGHKVIPNEKLKKIKQTAKQIAAQAAADAEAKVEAIRNKKRKDVKKAKSTTTEKMISAHDALNKKMLAQIDKIEADKRAVEGKLKTTTDDLEYEKFARKFKLDSAEVSWAKYIAKAKARQQNRLPKPHIPEPAVANAAEKAINPKGSRIHSHVKELFMHSLGEDLSYLKSRAQKPQQQQTSSLGSRGGSHGSTIKPHKPGAQSSGASASGKKQARPVTSTNTANGGVQSPAEKIRLAALKAQKAHMMTQKAGAHARVASISHAIVQHTANKPTTKTMSTTTNRPKR